MNSRANPSNSSLQKGKKKVHFVIRRFSYIEPSDVPGDYSDLYYSQEEFDAMHVDSRAIIQLMQTCMPVKLENGLCSRGLEDMTPHGARRRIWNHARAVASVNREQIHQKEDNCFDPEKMAQVYSHFSTPCQKQAHKVGQQDAIDALKILREKTDQDSDCDQFDVERFSKDSNRTPISRSRSCKQQLWRIFKNNNLVQAPVRVNCDL